MLGNPGPTFITKNVNGISDINRWDRILRRLKNTTFTTPIKAIFLQAHNLKQPTAAKDLANEYGFYMFAVPLNYTMMRGQSRAKRYAPLATLSPVIRRMSPHRHLPTPM